MRIVAVLSVGGLLFAATCVPVFAQAGDKPSGNKQIYNGVVTDSICGAKHVMKGMTDTDCARMCVVHGMDYALEVGPKIYTLKGNKDEIGKLAGSKARVTGTLTGDTITVDSIQAAAAGK